MVAVGLLQARGRVGTPQRGRPSIEGWKAVVGMVGVAVRDHIGEGKGLGASVQLLLSPSFLLYLLMEG